jgi:P27 family predicted phage terminase small subunit
VLKLIAGNPGKRPLPKGEPNYARVPRRARAPDWLTGHACEEWFRLAPELHPVGLLNKANHSAFASLCYWAGEERELAETVQRQGRLITTPNGSLQVHPSYSLLKAAAKHHRDLMVEFGLTPTSSPKVRVSPPDEHEDGRW